MDRAYETIDYRLVRACWHAGAGVECWRLGWRLGAGKKTKKNPVGWVLQQRVSFSARGALSNSTGLRAGSVPGFIMLPYPILIRIRIR